MDALHAPLLAMSAARDQGIVHVPLAGGVVSSVQVPLPVHGFPIVTEPVTVNLPPADVVPVKVKLGAATAPPAVPLAVVPSSAVPVPVLDSVHVTPPLAVPVRLAEAGGLGGDDHVTRAVLIDPLTVTVKAPQSASWGIGGAGALSGHPLSIRTPSKAPTIKQGLFMCLLLLADLSAISQAKQSTESMGLGDPCKRFSQTHSGL
jgi:hypothetical protein